MRDDMRYPFLFVTFWLLVAIFGLGMMHGESQADAGCYVDPDWTIVEDVTEPFMYMYATGDESQFTTYYTESIAYRYFDTDTNKRNLGYWLFIAPTKYRLGFSTTRYNYIVWVGTDWTVGTDGALHSPCAVWIVDYVRLYDYEAINNLQSVQRLVK